MSLERYLRPRMIILHPEASAYEAARAMLDNHIGALLVSEDQRVAGIVTDRDLVTEAIASGIDPAELPLRDVMAEELVTAPVSAEVADVVRLMTEHACRRIPILDGDRAVGLVTLDDLLLEGDIDAQAAAGVIRAQLSEPARYKARGAVHPEATARQGVSPRGARSMMRRSARAATAYARALKDVQARTGIAEAARAELALKIVLGSVCRRVTPEEARHFLSQLPSVLKDELARHLDGPHRHITRTSIENELASVLNIDTLRASQVAEGVAAAVADSISLGQIEELKGQLPAELRTLFPSWAPSARQL
ncbi:MAG: CBS domain-containing protein [Polyangiaceae bacterium]